MTREHAVIVIKQALSEVLDIPVSEIDSNQGLELYGVESLTMMEIVSVLEAELEIELYPADFLGASSIDKLADAIVKKESHTR